MVQMQGADSGALLNESITIVEQTCMKTTHLKIIFFTLILILFSFSSLTAQDDVTPTPQPTAEPSPTPLPRPTAVNTLNDSGVTVELLFEKIQQGRAGMFYVGGENVTGARIRFLDSLTDFFPAEDGFYGLLAIDMDQSPRVYDVSVFVALADGTRLTIPAQIEVALGGFVRQDFAVAADRAYLIDPEVERSEFARLNAIFAEYTPEQLWDGSGFQFPIPSEITSPFGAYRIINETVETRHTGWDLRAATGTPVQAMAAGKVAFAGLMDIRGNHVIIDHGYGIFSGYSHLSQIHVTRGQSVVRGQIIGVSGNTGRSNGPHLHWEITVNGQWVDSYDFLRMWMP